MNDYSHLAGWARIVSQIIDGVHFPEPLVRVGPTPVLLRQCGLGPFDLNMAPGKIRRAAREHPELPLALWQGLPSLLTKPIAVIPSARRDGSVIPVLVLDQPEVSPVLVPIIPDVQRKSNTILSVYRKDSGFSWIQTEVARAAHDGLPHFVGTGFTAALPKPGSDSEEPVPSSPGPIPVDGAVKPKRHILSLRKASTPDESGSTA